METQTPSRPRRERPKPVRLTDAATARVREIMAAVGLVATARRLDRLLLR